MFPPNETGLTGLDAGHADVAANKQFHNDSAIKLQNLDEEPSLLNKAAINGTIRFGLVQRLPLHIAIGLLLTGDDGSWL